LKNGNNRRPQLCEAWSAACGNGPTSGAIGMGEYVGFWRSPFLAQAAPPLAPSEGLEPPGGREIDIRVAPGSGPPTPKARGGGLPGAPPLCPASGLGAGAGRGWECGGAAGAVCGCAGTGRVRRRGVESPRRCSGGQGMLVRGRGGVGGLCFRVVDSSIGFVLFLWANGAGFGRVASTPPKPFHN